MGGCQNYGPFLGTPNIGGRIIVGIQKGIRILTTTHIGREREREIYIYIHIRSMEQNMESTIRSRVLGFRVCQDSEGIWECRGLFSGIS